MKLTIDSPGQPSNKRIGKVAGICRRRECGAFFVEGGDELLCLARAEKPFMKFISVRTIWINLRMKKYGKNWKKMEIDTIRISKTAFSKASYRSENYGMIVSGKFVEFRAWPTNDR